MDNVSQEFQQLTHSFRALDLCMCCELRMIFRYTVHVAENTLHKHVHGTLTNPILLFKSLSSAMFSLLRFSSAHSTSSILLSYTYQCLANRVETQTTNQR